MSTEEQRIACAELCGWKMFPASMDSFGVWCEPHASKEHETILQSDLPDYPNDERTRKEMLAVLSECQKVDLLCLLTGNPNNFTPQKFYLKLLELSQPDFCRAFLIATGKWKE